MLPLEETPTPLPLRAKRWVLLSPALRLVPAVIVIVAVGAFDEITGPDVSLILFYLAAIAFGTWFVSRRAGILLSGLAGFVSFVANGIYFIGVREEDPHVPMLVWNGLVQVGTSFAVVFVLAALRSRLENEELLARTDALTQIPNRRAFFETARLELERFRRRRHPTTVVYVDVDDFKHVNDRLGHAQGDALLVTVAQTLREGTRAVDSIARLGGDEFGLLLPETDAGEAEAMLGRLRSAVLAAMARNGWNVGVSIGAATFLVPPASVDEMMARADELMYTAKREEKGSIRMGVFPAVAPVEGGASALPR